MIINNNKPFRVIPILSILCCLSPTILAQTQLPEPAKQQQLIPPGETPQGLSTHEWSNIQQQINAAKYRAQADDKGGYQAINPAQDWHIQYAVDGTTTLTPRNNQTKPYHLRMKLSAIGYQNLQTLHKPQKISQKDFTVSYQWTNNIRERWINSEQQLEQWFDIAHKPEGSDKGLPLTVQMTLDSELKITQNGNNIQFVNPEGTDISYNKLKVWDSTGRELSARMQLVSNTLNLLVDDTAAQYPLTIDPSFQQQAFIKPAADYNSFGTAVAISGNTLVVGAPNEDSSSTGVNGDQIDNSKSASGAAYVYSRTGSTWTQQAYLKASNTDALDKFGTSVSISGDTLVVGAPFESSNSTEINGGQTDNSAEKSGAVYVFTRSGTTWTQQAYLKASNTNAGDFFGRSIAILGDTLVVGAPEEDSITTGINGNQSDNSAPNSGAVYIFTRSDRIWTQQTYLKPSTTSADNFFGVSVAISGDTIATVSDKAVLVFIRSGSTWTQQANLKASDTFSGRFLSQSINAGSYFIKSPIAISGDTLIVGAPFDDYNINGQYYPGDNDDTPGYIDSSDHSGAAYIYNRSGSTWTQQDRFNRSFYQDYFGVSVAISGNTIMIGSLLQNDDDNSMGNVTIYTRDDSQSVWTGLSSNILYPDSVEYPNRAFDDRYGASVAIDGTTMVVGSPGQGTNNTGVNNFLDIDYYSASGSGATYIFALPPPSKVKTLSIPIQTGTDDAEENLNDGDVSLFSSDLELIQDGLKPQVAGLRFPLDIPAGAIIVTANIQFTADETSSASTHLRIRAEATEHALTFSDIEFDISSRATLSKYRSWNLIPAWTLKGEASPDQQTPDLSSLVEEIVNQAGWATGNSMAFILSGRGIREAESFDGTAPPVLNVTYYIPADSEVSYTIGDTGPGGGIVFHTSNGGINGLEVAPNNLGSAIWGCYTSAITGAKGAAVDTGAQNTSDILTSCPEDPDPLLNPIAAKIANDYTLNGVADWHLPSTGEALLMYQQRDLIGLSANFWTSTENSAYSSFYLRLSQGDTRTGNKSVFFDVWPIKAF